MAFVNGIRDIDIKLSVCSTQKSTFAHTVVFALVRETIRTISRQQVNKVRRTEVVEDKCAILFTAPRNDHSFVIFVGAGIFKIIEILRG